MGTLETEVVFLTVQRAITAGRRFANGQDLRAYLRQEIKFGDEFLRKVSEADLLDCLLQVRGGVQNPPRAPTPPPPTPPHTSSADRSTDSESVADECLERTGLRPTLDSNVRLGVPCC
jgi:hypothetical protein